MSDEDVANNAHTTEKEASSGEENTLSAPSSDNESDTETKIEKDDGGDTLKEEDTEVEEEEEKKEEGEGVDAVVAEEPTDAHVEKPGDIFCWSMLWSM